MGTWHDPDVGRPIAAPLERCAELERQLRPEAYGRRRGGYLDRRRTPAADA